MNRHYLQDALVFCLALVLPVQNAVANPELAQFMDVVESQAVELTEANCNGPIANAHWSENDCGFQFESRGVVNVSMCTASSTGDSRPCASVPSGTDECTMGGACDEAFRFYVKGPQSNFMQPRLFPNVDKMNAMCMEVEINGDFQWKAPIWNKQCQNCVGHGPYVSFGTYNNLANEQGNTYENSYEGYHYYMAERSLHYHDLSRVWHVGGNRYFACFPNAIHMDRRRAILYRPWGPPFGNNGLGTVWNTMTYLYANFRGFNCGSGNCSITYLRLHGMEIKDKIIWEPRILHNVQAGQTYRFVLHTDLTRILYPRQADGTANLYVDGVLTARNAGGNLSSWNAGYGFALANEFTNDRGWLGELHLVAVYDRALTSAEVQQNLAAGASSSPPSPPSDTTAPGALIDL